MVTSIPFEYNLSIVGHSGAAAGSVLLRICIDTPDFGGRLMVKQSVTYSRILSFWSDTVRLH
jgi:hypothetical protein